ncbi:hypothetical protein KHS38_11945 [Mucilaginibacter sp. Bleaf8]|uniref:hypothetical protein n=1 Tax=Mucilaginibacter sp. Bleaf8 TaxID=2834430 RepID=UPI001BCA6BC1|nr:hypothetical protein [Mucilaginibacter sp. Bleaf8]MBS7565118.1 hypothetical protein [Mucilaginibacter sp. Bleaf8]
MSKALSPEQVDIIQAWANSQIPKPTLTLTDFEPASGANGVLVEFNELTIDQAQQLHELRRKIHCHVSIGNSKNLDHVVFDKLFLADKPMSY